MKKLLLVLLILVPIITFSQIDNRFVNVEDHHYASNIHRPPGWYVGLSYQPTLYYIYVPHFIHGEVAIITIDNILTIGLEAGIQIGNKDYVHNGVPKKFRMGYAGNFLTLQVFNSEKVDAYITPVAFGFIFHNEEYERYTRLTINDLTALSYKPGIEVEFNVHEKINVSVGANCILPVNLYHYPPFDKWDYKPGFSLNLKVKYGKLIKFRYIKE